MTSVRSVVPVIALVTVALVAGCGGGSSPSGGSAGPTSSPSSSQGRAFGGANSAEFIKIRQCLQAAGITLPTPSPRPSVSPAEPRPTRSPGERGAGRGLFTEPKVQAALKACGITPPSPGSFRRSGASPSPSA
jgi:hypothetical protein